MRLPRLKFFDFFYRLNQDWPLLYNGVTQLFSFGQWERWQNKVFEDLEGKKILEIGVGPGKLLARMAKKGYIVTGIEYKKGMADEARKRVKTAGYDVDILLQPLSDLPFKDEEFDCIVMTFVLAEIEDLDQAIREMRRVLKSQGKIIVISGGRPQDRNIFADIIFRFLKHQTDLKLDRDNTAIFKKHGFEVSRKDFGPFNVVNKIIAVKR